MIAAGLGFFAAFFFIFFGIPIAIALAVVGFTGFWLLVGFTPALSMISIVAKESTMSYPLSVIPLFLLMGNFIAGAGISGDLFRAAQAFVGRRRGGLAMATVLSCGGFAAVCGSSIATAVTMGKVALPPMKKFGYADSLATASVAAGGTLGILIPPSVIMVVYGIMTETHIGKLFAAGIIPGIVAVLGYLLAVRLSIAINPNAAPPASTTGSAEKLAATKRVWPVLLLFAIVLGGIYGGVFTTTEAAGIGAVGGLLLGLVRRAFTFETFRLILVDTAETTAIMFGLLLGATAFSEFMNFTGVHDSLLAVVNNSALPSWMVIAFILLLYLVLGCVLESLSMILLTIPVIFPVVVGLGYDPIWFGILVVMMVELGLITPPLGINLFILRSVAKEVSLSTIIRGILPFVTMDVLRILLLALIPALTLWLPGLLFD